ncbi:MAG: class I SAM-dependent methyltransferase, partial [Bacteroidota bacterium]
FLDIGCGSGVFSAAATRLGAQVYAFDYDQNSTDTTKKIISRFGATSNLKRVYTDDVLNLADSSVISAAKYIYSWGVLHHTGDLWGALSVVSKHANPGASFVLAIYNNAAEMSKKWLKLKSLYVNVIVLRPIIVFIAWKDFWAKHMFHEFINRRDPFRTWREYSIDSRGMSAWYDLVDWAGGYPYECASIDEVTQFMSSRGFRLDEVWRNDGIGNNEFRFTKIH